MPGTKDCLHVPRVSACLTQFFLQCHNLAASSYPAFFSRAESSRPAIGETREGRRVKKRENKSAGYERVLAGTTPIIWQQIKERVHTR